MKKRQILRWLGAAVVVGFGCLAYAYLTLPDVRPLADIQPDDDARSSSCARGKRTAAANPRRGASSGGSATAGSRRDLKRAVLVAEDAAFWQHEGVDFDELQKSIEADWTRGQLVRGAQHDHAAAREEPVSLAVAGIPLRKLRELIIARRLEAELKKARILELYLNVIEWGDGIYGAEAAARTYFQRVGVDARAGEGGAAGGGHHQSAGAQSRRSRRRGSSAASSSSCVAWAPSRRRPVDAGPARTRPSSRR